MERLGFKELSSQSFQFADDGGNFDWNDGEPNEHHTSRVGTIMIFVSRTLLLASGISRVHLIPR